MRDETFTARRLPSTPMGPADQPLTVKLNLGCDRGHRWYAPQPEEWLDRSCSYPLGDNNLAPRCGAPVRLLDAVPRP